jgi:hypothetical protein
MHTLIFFIFILLIIVAWQKVIVNDKLLGIN